MSLQGYALLALLVSTRGDLSFIAVGDWGGKSDKHPTTAAQELTSTGMQAVAEDLGSSFTLLVGDNFYRHGIAGNALLSSRFKKTFRETYAHKMPRSLFYVLAGNHDYGEGRQANVSAQLEYSKVDPQWHFPALWHKVHRKFTVGAHTRIVDILLIDTVILCGNGHKNEIFIENQLHSLWPHVNRSQSRKLRHVIREEQWAWLERELETSAADFLWVAGHYPVWSVGEHGPSKCLIKHLLPLLRRHNAHYISGHDHMSEHFQHEGFNNFVVGAGMECCCHVGKHKHIKHIPRGALQYVLAEPGGTRSSHPVNFTVHGGFGSFRFNAEYASVTLHAHNGYKLYTAPRIPRRKLPSSMDSVQLLEAHPWQPWIAVPAVASCLSLLFLVMYCQNRLNVDRARTGVTEGLLKI